MTINIYCCGQESLRRNGVALIVNKTVWNAVLGRNLKNDRMISVCFQGKSFKYHSNPRLCSTDWCWRSWSWTVLWRHLGSSRTNTKKDILFITGDWNAKVGSQEIPGVAAKFGTGVQNEAGQKLTVLPRECTGHSKHLLPTTQEMTLHMDITRRSIPKSDWLYSLQLKMEKFYTVSKNKTRSWLWLRSWPPYCKIQTYIEDSREKC